MQAGSNISNNIGNLLSRVSAPWQNEREPAPNPRGGTEEDEPLLVRSMPSYLTYSQLALLIRRLQFTNQRASSKPSSKPVRKVSRRSLSSSPSRSTSTRQLTPELTRKVMSFLIVWPVNHDNVTVVGCSSHDQKHPIQCCLQPDEDTWWISNSHTMNMGRGCEYVEFQLTQQANCSASRLTSVAIKIPPLPMGPLSVREFELRQPIVEYVLTSTNGSETTSKAKNHHPPQLTPVSRTIRWKTIQMEGGNDGTTCVVQNVSGWQIFRLQQPIDVKLIRVVCLSNQISRFMLPESALPTVVSPFDSVGFYAVRFD